MSSIDYISATQVTQMPSKYLPLILKALHDRTPLQITQSWPNHSLDAQDYPEDPFLHLTALRARVRKVWEDQFGTISSSHND